MRNYELRIETSEMKKALDVLSTVVNTKNPLPILGDALVKYDRERRVFTMTAGNGDMWLQTDCTRCTQDDRAEPWMFEDTGNRGDGKREPLEAFCIGVSDFREAFGNLPSLPAQCFLQIGDEGGTLRVTYNKGEFSLPVESAIEYPAVPRVVEQGEEGNAQPIVKFTIATQQLLPLISAARTCTADDELRPVMNAVCLDCFHDRMVIASTNGHCLYRRSLDLGAGWLRYGEFPTLDPSTGQSGHAIVLLPKQTVSPLMKALSQAETVTLTADSQRISIEGDGRRLTTACIEGRYPNYDSVIPQNSPHHVILDRAELMATLRRIGYFSSEASNMGTMRYLGGGSHFEMEASDLDFGRKAAEKVAIVNGESLTLPDGFAIGYKISTMLSVLGLAAADNIVFDLADPSRAIVIREDDANSSLTLLCMPMLVNE